MLNKTESKCHLIQTNYHLSVQGVSLRSTKVEISIKCEKRICKQTTLFIPTLNTTIKFVIMTIWLSRSLRLRGNSHKLSKNIVFNTLTKHMFWIFVRPWGDSNKYPKHKFFEEIWTNQNLSCISICSLSILYNSKFILMAASLVTNAVVVTRVHCI